MAYRYDENLEFLRDLDSEELKDFAELLYLDPKDGKTRITESVTSSDEFKKYGKDYAKYWYIFAEELQRYGGNTAMNLVRSGGVSYKEILRDVCKSQKIGFDSKASVEIMEATLLTKLLEDIVLKMNDKEKSQFALEVGIKDTLSDLTPQMLTTAAIVLFRQGGFKSYILVMKIVNYIWKMMFNKGLMLTTNATINKTIGIAVGPIGWTATGIWTALDIASPATRVTLPAVLQIILLRQLHKSKNEEVKKEIDSKNP